MFQVLDLLLGLRDYAALQFEHIDVVDDNFVDIYVIPVGDLAKAYSIGLTQSLRMSGFIVEEDYLSRNMKGNFKQADRLKS